MKAAEKTGSKLQRLKELFAGSAYLLIGMQDSPDPDSIAAAVALRRLANSMANLQCSFVCGGVVGRGENRALVRYLGLNLRAYDEIDYSKFDLLALVDTQPGTGNNSLPQGIIPDIVIDHHPIRRQTRAVTFTDVRGDYGATSTILVEYLLEADIAPDAPLATALLYGIRSDTQDLGREASHADVEALVFLYPLANKRMLGVIERGKYPREYYQLLADALRNARVYGSAVITSLSVVNNPDIIAEVADLLLRDDETDWVLCSGCWDGKLLFSIRTAEEGVSAEKIVRRLVARRGTGGGHATYAGGQLPLGAQTPTECQKLRRALERKFLRIIGLAESPGTPLIDSK